MKSITISTITAIVLFTISCKKEGSTANNNTSVQSRLVNKNWRSAKMKSNGVSLNKWCWMGSFYNFYEDGNVFITEGNNYGLCEGNVPGKISKYKYTISDDEKWLVINVKTPAEDLDSFMIVLSTENKLNLKREINKGSVLYPMETWEDELSVQ
jgi:endoglucanase Acf2